MEAADRDAGSEKVRLDLSTVNEFRPPKCRRVAREGDPSRPFQRTAFPAVRPAPRLERDQPPVELSFRMIASTRTMYWFALLISPCA